MSKHQPEVDQSDPSDEEDNDSDSFHSATDGENEEPESKEQSQQLHSATKPEQEMAKLPAFHLSSSSLSSGNPVSASPSPASTVPAELAVTPPESAPCTSPSSSSKANSNNEDEEESFEKVSSNTTSSSEGRKGKGGDEAFFRLPHLPEQPKKRVVKKGKTLEKEQHSDSNEEEDDWFKAQLGESAGSKKSSFTCKHTYAMQEGGKKVEESGSKSIWDWTSIQDVVNAMGDSISNVVETGLGLPNPETMAKLSVAERRKLMEEAQNIKEPEPSLSSPALSSDEGVTESGIYKAKKSRSRHHSTQYSGEMDEKSRGFEAEQGGGGGLFSGAGLFSGLVSGSLDVLETLGKKTFETLTVKNEGEGESSRRFFLQHDSSSQNLSELLRELRETDQQQTDTSTKTGESKSSFMGYGSTTVEKFNTNFVSFFEKSEGMVHLEGLEILAKDQEKRTKALSNSALFEEKLLDFCVEDVSECSTEDFDFEINKSIHCLSLPYKPDSVLEMNKTLTQELSLRQAAVDNDEEIVVDAIHEAAITSLAKLTAHSIQALHKLAQLIIIAKDLPEIDSLFAFTYLLCRRLSFFASQYANILSLVESSSKVDEVVTNIFFECSNACHYVKKALELLRPFFKKQV